MGNQKKRFKNGLHAKNTIIVTVVVILTLFIGALGGIRQTVRPERFAQGVLIDGVDVSGLSYDRAEELVADKETAKLSGISLPVTFKDKTVVFGAEELGIGTNAGDVLREGFNYNNQEGDSLAEKFDKSVLLNGKQFSVDLVVDEGKLRDTITEFSKEYGIRPVDARALYNKYSMTFTYIREEKGLNIDIDTTVLKIIERIREGDYSELVIRGEPVDPSLSLDVLKKNTVSIGTYTTTTTDDENRNTNIQLICEAIDGIEMQPGEVLSINGLVGERTAEKGFKSAPAIIDGKKLTNELGGGICQVSGTLYNAALLADMEIVERVHHSWPSSYLPVGLDSTLNWEDKDLKIKNTSDLPVYISATFQDRTVKVEIFGAPLPDGITVEIDNNILNKIDPPPPDIIYTNELPAGVRKTQISPRGGYDVEVTRNYLIEGKIVDSELISKDYYPAVKGVILEGTEAQEK